MANKILYVGKDSVDNKIYLNTNDGEHYVGVKNDALRDSKVLYIQYQKFYKEIYAQNKLVEIQ